MVKLKELELSNDKFSLALTTSPSPRLQDRLCGMLSVRGPAGDENPCKLITQLHSQNIAARAEENTNACGHCLDFCLWNTCFSVPKADLQELITTLQQATEKLYGPSAGVDLTIKAQGKVYKFWWRPNRLQYINFDGIPAGIISRLKALPNCLELEVRQYEGKDAATIMTMAPSTNLTTFVEEVCLAIS